MYHSPSNMDFKLQREAPKFEFSLLLRMLLVQEQTASSSSLSIQTAPLDIGSMISSSGFWKRPTEIKGSVTDRENGEKKETLFAHTIVFRYRNQKRWNVMFCFVSESGGYKWR